MGLRDFFKKPYAKVGPLEAEEMVGAGAVLLDVRGSDEWSAGHAAKARHIPLGELERRAKELPQGRDVVTICRSGVRSARAASLLAKQGRTVHNVSGGMRAWSAAGLPVLAKGGRPGNVI